MTEVTTEIPRSRSIAIQSERVERRSRLAFTWPARLMAPPNRSNFSVSVVLPASGCEIIANVRLRSTSVASGVAAIESEVARGLFIACMWPQIRAKSSRMGRVGALDLETLMVRRSASVQRSLVSFRIEADQELPATRVEHRTLDHRRLLEH